MSTDQHPIRPPGLAPELMTDAEAQAYLGCKRTRFAALIRSGEIIRAESLGRHRLVTRASVEAKRDRMLGLSPAQAPRARRRRHDRERAVDLGDAFELARARDVNGTESSGKQRRSARTSGS